jgi:hypothetical protein
MTHDMPAALAGHFEIRFRSLFDPGRSLAFPCDCEGHVQLEAFSERARINYLYARAMVGREFELPCVESDPEADDGIAAALPARP